MTSADATRHRLADGGAERAGDPRRAIRATGLLAGAAIGILIVGVLVGLVLVGRHGGGPIQGWDDAAERWYLHHRAPLVGVSKFIATYLDALPLGIICVLLSAILGLALRSPRALVPFVAYLGGEFEVFAIRTVIHRHRPPTANYPAPGAVPGVHETSFSFPSGHSVAVTAVLFALLGCVALARRIWWPWVLALVCSLFVIDTRLVLGVHWLSDVAIGLLAGIVWGVAVARAVQDLEWVDLAAARGLASRGQQRRHAAQAPSSR
jgi:undecaprenyl-diphosphatase